MIDQQKLIDLYCEVKTKEELLRDIDIENQNPRIHFEFFAHLVQNLSPEQKKVLFEMTDKETIVKFIKMSTDDNHPKPMVFPNVPENRPTDASKRCSLTRIRVDRDEMMSVVSGVGLPEWYRAAVREITGENAIAPVWRGRYKLMYRSLCERDKDPFVYDYAYDHYLKAVQARKNDQQGDKTDQGEF